MNGRGAIENTLAAWALGYDEREPERMAACFTEDAVMTMDIAGDEQMGPFVGHAEVMGLFTEHHGIQTDQRRHVVTNVVIDDPTDEGVPVTSYLTLLVTNDGELRAQATGVYRDVFVERDGRWLISRRHLYLDRHY
ncbi:MAG TPA: nuclear transport factor 2 family protein [Acidimicrobiales bacterium]|nr:nuclear transport factor 2 family protein [Acidimicrobiales bacterium]